MEHSPLDYTAVGRKIRRLRKEKKLTQEQFAELIGRSTSFVGHIERGTRILNLDTFINIVQVLDCSADDLLCIGTEGRQNRISAEILLQLAADLASRK